MCFFNITELVQCYLKIDHLNFIFFSFVGDASSQRPPLPHEYLVTRHALHERMQSQSYFEEHPKNEDIDIDEMLRNFRAKKKRPTKTKR
jgi:protocatechuate 3,4-dioxygenase beta subunit